MKREYPYIKGATEQGLFFWNNQLSAIHGRAADIAPDSGFSYFFNSACGTAPKVRFLVQKERESLVSSQDPVWKVELLMEIMKMHSLLGRG